MATRIGVLGSLARAVVRARTSGWAALERFLTAREAAFRERSWM